MQKSNFLSQLLFPSPFSLLESEIEREKSGENTLSEIN